MSGTRIEIPPLELRQMVGPVDVVDFDNPGGEPIYKDMGVPVELYESVFDFGCGYGRIARRLLLQNPRPRRYVGIDPHRVMIEWAQKNLSSVDAAFQFIHHDVYSPSYADQNTLQLSQPFPVEDDAFSLVIAHSVFTHLCRQQTEYYLGELCRILQPHGLAFTTWFFFDRDSFRFLPRGPYCLYTSERSFDEAVVYDRKWFIEAIHRVGLGVTSVPFAPIPGHQWTVLLEKRSTHQADQFPLGEEWADWVCGATLKPRADVERAPRRWPASPISAVSTDIGKRDVLRASPDSAISSTPERPKPPELFPVLRELRTLRWSLASMQQSWSWKIGRAVTAPARALRALFRSS
jgi:SAM-dependent methyltransferase